ncbi:MAG: hypothetical protein A2126_03100 [Candidatus Woykebacteria bacterium GWB1_45_5]|uniref:Bacterial Ig domain-containing protein n=2 Tax=Candidatus Woykeibacteriota TaxID=1817899 RepID=A0A1G1VZZ9_9BACT|nr:MAG: hypothetical protein A2113_01630 [Candidatus Woykebacteria bacterium GWA1_44_8]OGY23569.1 MAG: hypothetical protein A2126_03100 [Candidatus Woykebacteria bacterium GWB1_45_5]
MKRDVRVGVPSYTYRQTSKEEKMIYRRLTIIGGVTIVILLIVWFWGLTFVRVIGWLGTKTSGNEAPPPEYEIPLQKPALHDLPEFTNQDKITISGSATAQANVILVINGTEIGKTVADSSGSFSFVDAPLKIGTNLIKVTASDKTGKSLEERAIVTLDKQLPNLQVSEPSNKQDFPKGTKQITIKGTAEAESTVFVNSIQAMLDQNAGFAYSLDVSPGENKIEVKAVDNAGNSKIIDLTVTVEQ